VAGIGSNIFGSFGASAQAETDSSAALATATYGPTAPGAAGGAFSPRHGHGMGFWLSVAGVVVLVLVRQSLPR
jgi:hypothetical protein